MENQLSKFDFKYIIYNYIFKNPLKLGFKIKNLII